MARTGRPGSTIARRTVAEVGRRERLRDQIGELGDLQGPLIGGGVMKASPDHDTAVLVAQGLRRPASSPRPRPALGDGRSDELQRLGHVRRRRPIPADSDAMASSWVVYDLVAATASSGPAARSRCRSASRAIGDSTWFVIASVGRLWRLAFGQHCQQVGRLTRLRYADHQCMAQIEEGSGRGRTATEPPVPR